MRPQWLFFRDHRRDHLKHPQPLTAKFFGDSIGVLVAQSTDLLMQADQLNRLDHQTPMQAAHLGPVGSRVLFSHARKPPVLAPLASLRLHPMRLHFQRSPEFARRLQRFATRTGSPPGWWTTGFDALPLGQQFVRGWLPRLILRRLHRRYLPQRRDLARIPDGAHLRFARYSSDTSAKYCRLVLLVNKFDFHRDSRCTGEGFLGRLSEPPGL